MKTIVVQSCGYYDETPIVEAVFSVPDDFSVEQDRKDFLIAVSDRVKLTRRGTPYSRHTCLANRLYRENLTSRFGATSIEILEEFVE